MANVILPLVHYLLALGKTIDITNYDLDYRVKTIYEKHDFVETTVNALNSTYYVLPDEKIPYNRFNVPIDLVVGLHTERYPHKLVDGAYLLPLGNFESAAILISAEYRTIEQSIKENATPISKWQESQNIPKSHTHYVDKVQYGGRCNALISIRSNVTGDVQIFRRILREVMGESGSIGKDTADLWKKALKAIRESEDVRGNAEVAFGTALRYVQFPEDVYDDAENLFKRLSEFPEYVKVRPLHGPLFVSPLYATLKPLHDLDERYPYAEKNAESERYLVKLDNMLTDLDYTYNDLRLLDYKLSEDDHNGQKTFQELYKKIHSVRSVVRKLAYSDLSMYKNINASEFKITFDKYQKGLDNSTQNYFAHYMRVYEKIGVRCENSFLKPTRGSLIVEENEVVKKGNSGLVECQDHCVKDDRCRAVGYNETNKECLIYYRSTRSARISRGHTDAKVYDRKCK